MGSKLSIIQPMSTRKSSKKKAKKHLSDHSWSQWLGAAGLALAIVLFVASIYGLGKDNDVYHSYDFREIFTYQKSSYENALLQFHLPLWNPYTFSGWPFLANALVQAFYLPSLLYLVLPQPAAVIVDLILHLLLGAAGTYLLLRITFRLRRETAAFGALIYPISGSFVSHAYAGHVQFYAAAAYTPLLMLAIDRSVTFLTEHGGTPGKIFRSPSFFYRSTSSWLWIGSLLLGLQILSGGLPFVWLALLLIGLYRLGIVLSYAPLDYRAWLRNFMILAVMTGIAAGVAAIQLAPTYEMMQLSNRPLAGYDYAITASYDPKLLPTILFPRIEAPGHKDLWEYYGYAGVLPLLLAIVGLSRFRSDRRIIVLAVISVLMLLFMFGSYSFLFKILWKYVPGFQLFRAPARAMVNLNLIIALLAAIGFEAVIGRLSRKHAVSRMLVPAIALLVCTVTWIDVTVAARDNRDRLFIPDKGFMERPAQLQHEKIIQNDRSWYRYWFRRSLFRENHAFAFGARSISGYDNMYLQRYSRFIHAMTDTPIKPSLVTILTQNTFENTPSPFPFKILGVKYADHADKIYSTDSLETIRRAWFVTRTRKVLDENEALAYMRSETFKPFQEVVFEASEADRLHLPLVSEGGSSSDSSILTDIEVTELRPERLRIELGPHPSGYLVLSEIYYPGWLAKVDGREVPIYRADSILRCVPLGANARQVDMMFKPAMLRYGAFLSIISLMLISVGLLFSIRR